MTDHRQGIWARDILAAQHADGTWGSMFHSLAQPAAAPLTTEQALRRLHALGFTMEDEAIRRCVDTMAACLRGERKIDAYWESGIDWAMFEPLILAAWIRRFDRCQPDALTYARRWARVTQAAFASGTLDVSAWNAAYEAEFHRKARHPHPLALSPFYHGMLLPDMLTATTEQAFVRHILRTGMYYVHPAPLVHPPAEFASRQASYWLAALEVLAEYRCAQEELAFAVAWLHMNSADGQWDFGPKASDKIHFPLSDSWRSAAVRRADCTERVHSFLDQIK